MKITTWNVNGLRAREGQVAEWVWREKPDVLCLQEIKATHAQVPPSLLSLDGYYPYWHGNAGGYSGVSLHVRHGFAPKHPVFSHPSFDLEGRVVTAALGTLELVSMYVPNGGKDFAAKLTFLEAMVGYVEGLHAQGRHVVLCGDLNVALTRRDVHPTLVDEEKYGQTPRERELLGRVIDSGLVDLLRHFAPDDEGLFTWWAPWRNSRERNVGWRLDYVLASKALAAKATSCRCDHDFGSSDHAPVTATFEGALFDPAQVLEGRAQPAPAPESEKAPKAKAPQLDLFS